MGGDILGNNLYHIILKLLLGIQNITIVNKVKWQYIYSTLVILIIVINLN